MTVSGEQELCQTALCGSVCVLLCISPITQDPEGAFANLALLMRFGEYELDVCKIRDVAYLAVNHREQNQRQDSVSHLVQGARVAL